MRADLGLRLRVPRPSEDLHDGRRWSTTDECDGSHEFASAMQIATVLPSEFDRVEVGHRAARAFAEAAADGLTDRMPRLVQVLHPAEVGRARLSGSPDGGVQ